MIQQKKKICKSCGADSYIYSKSRCKSCSIKEDFKPIKKFGKKELENREKKKEYTLKQFELFKEFYNKHPTKRCEQCNVKIKECLSINVHHLLPKSKYKDVALEDKYWMLLCGNCHSNWERSNIGDKIKLRTELAKKEYNE